MPAQVSRQPSEQDLELAKQLLAHSQGIQSQPPPQTPTTAESVPQGFRQVDPDHGSRADVHEYHGLEDSIGQARQAYRSPSISRSVVSDHASQAAGGAPVGGQMCRYV